MQCARAVIHADMLHHEIAGAFHILMPPHPLIKVGWKVHALTPNPPTIILRNDDEG